MKKKKKNIQLTFSSLQIYFLLTLSGRMENPFHANCTLTIRPIPLPSPSLVVMFVFLAPVLVNSIYSYASLPSPKGCPHGLTTFGTFFFEGGVSGSEFDDIR